MRTISQHVGLIQHAVGATPDSRHDLYHTLNRAGRMLTRIRSWWWRLVPGVSLPAVISSTDIALPSDFQTLDTIALSSGLGPVYCLTPDQYTQAKANASAGATEYGTRVLLPVMTYADETGAETKVLRMLTAATANGSPTFLISYYREWFDVTSANDADYPHIPPDFDDALMLAARACALDLQDQMESHEMMRFREEVALLAAEDIRRVPEFTPQTGGAMSRRRSSMFGSMDLSNP